MYGRIIEGQIREKFFNGKVLIVAGARQTGKTTLVFELVKRYETKKVRSFNCDNPTDRGILFNKDFEFLKHLVGNAEMVVIDEGQKVKNIGQTLKLLVDFYKNKKQIIVTGSSSINLLDRTEEPLTGRKLVYNLFPLSVEEIYRGNLLKLAKELEILLIFGTYPDVINQEAFDDKIELLKSLTSSYLYQDILAFQNVKNSDVLQMLIKALALQLGSEVSYNELARLIGVDRKTVENYVNLLEKNFVIFRLSSYSKNKRRELVRSKKIYFYDLGVRNAIINNFSFLDSRNDVGALWENLMIVERLKYRSYHKIFADQYFWKTYDGSEVDLVEEKNGKIYGYEFKWGSGKNRAGPPKKWLEYKPELFKIISKENLKGWIL